MRIKELKMISAQAPAQGQLLIYPRNSEVLFQPYRSIAEVRELCGDRELLEVHLFDKEKEYRAVLSTGYAGTQNGAPDKNEAYTEGSIEYTADFPYDAATVFAEEMILDMESGTKQKTVTVFNHLTYDDSGLASVDDYRMVMGGIN